MTLTARPLHPQSLPTSFVALFVLSTGLVAQTAGQQSSSTKTRQVQAIQSACQAGALSPDECRQKLAALNVNAPSGRGSASAPASANDGANAAGHWSEPHGRYTIAVAPGWRTDDSQGTLKITKGDSWAIFDTQSSSGSPADVAQTNAQQMSGMVSDWQLVQQSPFETPRHHSSAGVTALASVPTQAGKEQRVLTFAAQSAGAGHYVTVTASSLPRSSQQDQGQVMAMFNSVRFAGE